MILGPCRPQALGSGPSRPMAGVLNFISQRAKARKLKTICSRAKWTWLSEFSLYISMYSRGDQRAKLNWQERVGPWAAIWEILTYGKSCTTCNIHLKLLANVALHFVLLVCVISRAFTFVVGNCNPFRKIPTWWGSNYFDTVSMIKVNILPGSERIYGYFQMFYQLYSVLCKHFVEEFGLPFLFQFICFLMYLYWYKCRFLIFISHIKCDKCSGQ